MEIKKGWRRLTALGGSFMKRLRLDTPRRKIIFGGIALAAVLLACLVISLLSVSDGEVALAELAESFKNEAICHEECYLRRQEKEGIIEVKLKEGDARLEKRIVSYWRDPEGNLEFKKELVRLPAAVYGKNNPPAYINDYLSDPDADSRLIREIISVFNIETAASDGLLVNLDNKINGATETTEKIEAIKTLGRVAGGSEIDRYFLLLKSEEEIEVKKQAVISISNILEKSKYFTLDQISLIESLILAPETDKKLRQDLVLLLGDYYLIYPDESEAVWRKIYKDKSLDSISRLFSADNLNHLAEAKLELPAISPEEWADYYNQ